jgi:hypothetical protein
MKRSLLPITLVVLLSVLIYSCSSDDDDSAASSVIQKPTPTPETNATQYTLTVSAGEGGSVSSEGGTYDEGTQLTIKANPSDGFGFAGWTNFESNSSTINITLNSNTSISASFITLPSLSMVSSSTSIFTKSKKDTLTFEANVPGGFNKLEINSDNGDVEIVSQPEMGATSGQIKLTYNPQTIVNIDYTRTIAGYEDVSVSIFDSYENNSSDEIRVKTQPEPLLNKNYVKSHLDLKFSRIKVDPRLIRFLNQRDNFSLGCYVDNNFGDTSNYNQNGNSYDELRDIAYVDLNLDGYDDIVLHPIFSNNNNSNFASVKFPIEVYMYINGEYIYREVLNQNGSLPEAFLVTKFLVGDFDNDGFPDLYCANHGTDSAPYISENQFFLYNDLETKGVFTQIDNTYNRNSHFGASADIDQDGDLDIFSGGLFPCDDNGRGCDFLINNGGRNFSQGDLLNDVTYLESKKYFTRNISTSDLYDVDEDGKIDLLLHGRGSEDNSASLPWFTQDQIDNMPFIASSGKIMFANSQGKYTLSDIKYIPSIPGYNKGMDFNIYDLDGDGQKEIIILLTGDGSAGEWSNSGNENDNQNTSNWYQGYQIQICQLDENRNIVDVTSQFMDGNGQKGVGLGCDNDQFMFLQIGDYDDNGLLDMYCEDFRRGPNFVRWEWNGSKFTNKTQ